MVIYGTSTPAQRDDPMPMVTKLSQVPASQTGQPTTPKNTILLMNTKGPKSGSGGGKKVPPMGFTPAYTIIAPPSPANRKNKNKSKNKSLQKGTTIRPLFAAVNSSKKLDYDSFVLAYTVTSNNNRNMAGNGMMTTMKPMNSLNQATAGNWGKQSLSAIPQKTAIKAPKQVKENGGATATGQTVMSRLPNLFEQYDKIQHIYPEFHPYQETSASSINNSNPNSALTMFDNNSIMTNFRATSGSLLSDTTTTSIPQPSSSAYNTKPSRANSKMILFSDSAGGGAAEYPKKKGTANLGYVRTQNSRTNQRNGNGLFHLFLCIFIALLCVCTSSLSFFLAI